MKTLKLILTNLILVFTLVILTSGIVYADNNWDVEINVNWDSNNKPVSYEMRVIKNGTVATLDELNTMHFTIKNMEAQGKIPIGFWVENEILKTTPLEECISDFPWCFDLDGDNNDDDVEFDYDIDKKCILINPKNSIYIDPIINSLNVTITEKLSNGTEKDTNITKSIHRPVNVNFSIFYSLDAVHEYILEIDGPTFKELGNVGIYDNTGECLQKTENAFEQHHIILYKNESIIPGKTLTIKNVESGQVYGSVYIERLDDITFETVGESLQDTEIVCKDKDGNILSLSDLKKYGWKTLNFERTDDKTGDKTKYTLNLSSLTFNNGNAEVSPDGKKITFHNKGTYEIWVTNPNGQKALDRKVYSVENSAFTATLERSNLEYTLVLEKTIEELKAYNNKKNYVIIIEDLEGNTLGSYDSYKKFMGIFHVAKNENTLTINKELYKYKQIRVRFYSEETGLNEIITLDVPELATFEDVDVKIICPGGIGFYDSEGNSFSYAELALSLGLDKNDLLQLDVYYENGVETLFTVKPEDTLGNIIDLWNINLFDSEIAKDYDKLVTNTEYYKAYTYFKTVVETGRDLPLTVNVSKRDDSTKKVEILVTKPEGTTSEYPYLEAITGRTIDEIKELVKIVDQGMLDKAEIVENGTLYVEPFAEKDFRINLSGNYYIYTDDDSQSYSLSSSAYGKGMLAKAGILTGDVKESKPVGMYICYDPEGIDTISYTEDFNSANCYPLLENCIYRISNDTSQGFTLKFEKVDVETGATNGELVEINDEKSGLTIFLQSKGDDGKNGRAGIVVGYIVSESKTFFENIESLIARFIMTLGNGLNYLVQMSLRAVSGNDLTTTVDIDKIIFNQYPDTSIAFFESNSGGEDPSKLIELFRDGVNEWYNKFRAIVIAGYLVILLYIGIRILLSVGGQKQAQYKELLSHWVVGIVLLVLFPYVIRYAIEINNLFVGMIEKSKTEVLKVEAVNNQIDMSNFSLPTIADKKDFGVIAQQMDEIPFADGDNSYMAEMARKAQKSGKIIDAIVYLVMVWQFIMIAITYYKRVFTIAFLIAIFPFVTLSYAIDKVADGKAQAFATWTRELMSNIFIQSIHAVVYVFVIGATYTEGEYNGDWLLSIIGISFLFKGEEILKKFVGQAGGNTVRSLTKTAARAVLTIKAAQKVTKNVSDNFIGADSHLGRTINTYRRWKTEEKVARNMDFLGKPAYTPPAGNSLRSYNSADASSIPDYDELAEDIQVVNNMDSINDPRKVAKALKNILDSRDNRNPGVQNLLSGLNLSNDQLHELAKLKNKTAQDYLAGDTSTVEKAAELKARLDSNMEAKLRIIFPGVNDPNDSRRTRPLSPDNMRKVNNLKSVMFVMLSDSTDRSGKHRKRNSDFATVKREYLNTERRVESFYNPDEMARRGIANPFNEEAKKPKLSIRAEAKRDSVLSTHYGTNITNATKAQIKMAESIAIMAEFQDLSDSTVPVADIQTYNAKQYMDSAMYIMEHQNDSRENKNAVATNFSVSGEEMVSVVSEQVTKTYTDVSAEPSGDHRRAIARGAKAEIPEPLTGPAIMKEIAVKNTQAAYDKAEEVVKKEDKEYGTRMYYDSSLDRFQAKDKINRDHHSGYDLDTYIGYMATKREEQNEKEAIAVEDFAREMLDDLPKYANEPTYNGLTKSEHEDYANSLRDKFVEELARTGTTTLGATLGAPIGAGLAIGLSDEESALKEGLAGAAIGILGGDQVAERAIGKELDKGGKSRKVKILNPYTNEIEDFELKKDGLTADATLIGLINSGEVLRYDDPRLDQYSYNLNRQFIEHKVKKQRAREADRRKQMFDEALRNSTNRS